MTQNKNIHLNSVNLTQKNLQSLKNNILRSAVTGL